MSPPQKSKYSTFTPTRVGSKCVYAVRHFSLACHMRASVLSFGHIRKIPRSTPVVAATSPERWSSFFFVQPHHRRTKPRRRCIHVVATANRRCEGRDDARVVASASPTESQTPEEDASTTPVPRLADARGTPSTIDTTMDTSASSFSVTPGSRASNSFLVADCSSVF